MMLAGTPSNSTWVTISAAFTIATG